MTTLISYLHARTDHLIKYENRVVCGVNLIGITPLIFVKFGYVLQRQSFWFWSGSLVNSANLLPESGHFFEFARSDSVLAVPPSARHPHRFDATVAACRHRTHGCGRICSKRQYNGERAWRYLFPADGRQAPLLCAWVSMWVSAAPPKSSGTRYNYPNLYWTLASGCRIVTCVISTTHFSFL